MKTIGLSIKQYIQDYDEKYPPLATAKPEFGWAGALQPYLKSTQIFQCNRETTPPQSAPSKTGYTDYWLSARVAHREEADVAEPGRTILLGDGNDGNNLTDARYHLDSLPPKWRSDTHSPLYRHDGGANFVFADGHAKRIPGDSWKNGSDNQAGFTLSIKADDSEVSR